LIQEEFQAKCDLFKMQVEQYQLDAKRRTELAEEQKKQNTLAMERSTKHLHWINGFVIITSIIAIILGLTSRCTGYPV